MAYTAGAAFNKPPVQGKKTYFLGYVGTQSDKAADAIDVFLRLLNDMPQYPERISDIKTYLKQAYLSGKPSFRNKSQVFEDWKKLGYSDDPAKVNLQTIDALVFDDVVKFFENNVKNKPVSIFIMGDPKLIDIKKLKAKYGKIANLSTNMLFSKE